MRKKSWQHNVQAVGAEVEGGEGDEGEGDKTQRDKATNRKPNSQKQTISAHFGLPNAPKPSYPPTLPHSHRKVVGFKGQECSYITVCECAQKEQSLRALKYIYVYTYCGMMKLATQRAQLQIISIMTTATKPNKVQKALEICNSKLSIAYF